MQSRLLHSVIDDVLEAAERFPEMAADILHFVFDETRDVREGLYETKTRVLGESTLQAGAREARGTAVVTQTMATDRLVQFAHAVARGFIPHVLPAGGA